MKFTMVDSAYVAWSKAEKAPIYTEFILSVLKGLNDNKKALKIEATEKGQLIITTKFIENNIDHCLSNKVIRSAIRFLADNNVIDYETNNHHLYVKLNYEKVNEITIDYSNDSNVLKSFILYHAIVDYCMKISPKCSLLSIFFSRIVYEKQNGYFRSEMSVSYIHNKFNKIFSNRQENYAKNLLIEHGFLSEEAPAYITDDGFGKRRYFVIHMDKVQKIFDEFKETENGYKYQDSVIVLDNNKKVYTTKDRLKSGSYTKAEIEEFKRKSEELEAAGEQWIF